MYFAILLCMDNHCTKVGNSQAKVSKDIEQKHLYKGQQFDLDFGPCDQKNQTIRIIYLLNAT